MRTIVVVYTQSFAKRMDLPTVKATVKAWEKAFKAQHQRNPTKEDIKKDTSGIGEAQHHNLGMG
jgi:thiamine biosynthesis lipoprotein ApbE